jgi:hypothetical protein
LPKPEYYQDYLENTYGLFGLELTPK